MSRMRRGWTPASDRTTDYKTPLGPHCRTAERAQGEGAASSFSMKLSGIMIGFGDAKVARYPRTPACTNAEPDHGHKDKERERRAGRGSGCSRATPDKRGPVGDENEDEQRADKGAIMNRLDTHGIADLAVHGIDDQFEGRLRLPTDARQAAP